MIGARPPRLRLSRESRLLVLTIVVSALVLILLARLRFPEAPVVVNTTAAPLERLAARASYDALAGDIERVGATIAPSLIALRVAPRAAPGPRRIEDVLGQPPAASAVEHVVALRLDGGTAVAAIDPDARVDGIVGVADPGGSAAVIAVDRIRRIARVRVPQAPARDVGRLALTALRTPTYVVGVEATKAGVTFRPIFLGRGDRFGTARWPSPLLPLGGAALAPGALLFTLTGEFLGCVVLEEGTLAIAGARDVLDAAERLAASPPAPPAAAGIALPALTPALAEATGAPRGVVVSDVDDDGPAAGVLQPADVITALDGQPVTAPDLLLLLIAARPIGATVTLTVVRAGASSEVPLTLVPAYDVVPQPGDGALGLARARGEGTRVTAVAPGSAYAAAGLEAGDIVTRAGEVADPTPARLRSLLAQPAPGGYLVLTVRRGGGQRVLAMRLPDETNAARE